VLAGWPGRLLEIYGLTEGGCTSILDVGAFPHKAHTVGQPAPGNDIRIIDEAGAQLPHGAVGELVGHSPAMMSGYFRNPAATAEFYWQAPDGRAFHRTGDVGMLDPDGFLVLLDRKKDIIISGGFNIYASDIERVLLDHEAVADAAVIGIASERWGETPLGLVVLREGIAMTTDALLAYVNARLGKLQRLSGVVLRESLPRSPAGKVLKQDLRAQYRDQPQ
ncbi:MAG: class I adenylate-forming enzyme family protein, partial [Devosia sp.]